jgi:hypothetical protein
MGDRVNFMFDGGDGQPLVGLYSHWGYSSRYTDLAAALKHAEPRWSDPDYCARMVISHLIKDDIDGEHHFGIFAVTKEDVYSGTKYTDDLVMVSLWERVVYVDGLALPYEQFIAVATN